MFGLTKPLRHLCRWPYNENLCKKEYCPAVQTETSFKIFSIIVLVAIFFQRSRTIWASLVEGLMRNICMVLFWILVSSLGVDVFKTKFPYFTLIVIVFSGAILFEQLWQRALGETFVWNCFKYRPAVQEKITFKNIFYFYFYWPFLADQNHLRSFGRKP